ncbi:Putative OMR family iron-siderophore receptor precursor [Methylophaga frappieri]|uniref:Putative OMR family iron-siderophore receptor n=1 Tax=Methylophaga frappieri (strain ATCC BAA-2434 / DSM 25690 / JAM7) TaxID=754477 RepID=I1YJB8_METFJ|nr:TonB-dependent siderophore receptor [Methylophaga frappieri]AFJ03011.1 Putative OMR family iron-siderophore receptor precursor [Methylophaga frappieri]
MRSNPTFLAASISLLIAQSAFAEVDTQNNQQNPSTTSETVSLPTMGVSGTGFISSEATGEYTTARTNTATRLGLSLRETPQSVTIISRQVIDDFQLETITDVVKTATGVSSKMLDSSRQSFSARGFAITNLMIDGVPTTWEGGYSAGETQTDTAIFDRVEIVRGATGLMTGAGNPSAAINLVRKRADSREFQGHAIVSAGSWDKYQGTVDISTPLNEAGTIRGRLVGSYRQGHSFEDLLEDERQVFFGTMGFDLTDRTLLNIGVSHQKHDPTSSMWGGLPTWFSDGSRTNWNRSKTTAADWSKWGSDVTNYYANLEHVFESGASIYAAYSKSINEGDLRLLYLSGSPDRVTGEGLRASNSWYDTEREQDNVDIYGNVPFSLFGREHEVTIGMMHSDQDFVADRRPATNPAPVGNFYQWDGSYPEPVWGPKATYVSQDTEQTGFYAVSRLSLADPLTLILGSRITDWEISGMQWNGSLYEFEHSDEVTPYAGLIYDFNDVYSAYVSYTDIFNPQNLQDKNGDYLDPIEGKNYEAGLKAAYLDGRLNASFSVFRIEQDNLGQVDPNNLVPGSINQQAYTPAEGATSKGFEIELAGALTENWNVLLGWSQFRAEDANGDTVNTSYPRRTATLYTTYQIQNLTFGAGVNWESSNYTIANNPLGNPDKLKQESYALANLMARYQITPDLQAQLNVNNLFDEKYYSQIGFYSQYAYGAPRNVTASLRYDF